MKERDSNIELLRLLCMAGIVLMHFIGLAVYPGVWNPSEPLSVNVIVGTLVCSLTIGSVNIFGLISGYYGIRFSWKRFLVLYLTCALYAVIGCGVGAIYGEEINIKTWLLETLLPFSHTSSGLWYVQCYVGLFLFAPLLNKAIDNLNKREYLLVLVLATIANVYMGRFWKVPAFNVYGYTVAQLVFLYLIGGFIRKNIDLSKLTHVQILVPMLVCVGIWNVLTLAQHQILVPHWSPTSYNHIVVLVASVCLLMLALKHPFKSKWINYLAPGSLAIYLFHQNGHIWKIISENLSHYESLHHTWGIVVLVTIALGECIIVVLFDKIRQHILKFIFKK